MGFGLISSAVVIFQSSVSHHNLNNYCTSYTHRKDILRLLFLTIFLGHGKAVI